MAPLIQSDSFPYKRKFEYTRRHLETHLIRGKTMGKNTAKRQSSVSQGEKPRKKLNFDSLILNS